jgi:hypothetical protein
VIKNLKKGKEYNFYRKDKSYEIQEWRLLFCLVLEYCYNQVFFDILYWKYKRIVKYILEDFYLARRNTR